VKIAKKKNRTKIPRSMRKKFQEYKRTKKAINDSHERLVIKAKQRANDPELELLQSSPKIEKMSEIIIDFAAPLLDVARNIQNQKQAITTAIIGWNLALLPKEAQPDQLNEIKKMLNPSNNSGQLANEASEILNFLVSRKAALYPEINRMIVDYELIDTPQGFHLNVVSNVFKNDE
jgi:hypothetical protein